MCSTTSWKTEWRSCAWRMSNQGGGYLSPSSRYVLRCFALSRGMRCILLAFLEVCFALFYLSLEVCFARFCLVSRYVLRCFAMSAGTNSWSTVPVLLMLLLMHYTINKCSIPDPSSTGLLRVPAWCCHRFFRSFQLVREYTITYSAILYSSITRSLKVYNRGAWSVTVLRVLWFGSPQNWLQQNLHV